MKVLKIDFKYVNCSSFFNITISMLFMLFFFVSISYAQANNTSLYIKENGNVGVGTEDPKGILHISKDTNHPLIYFTRGDVSNFKDSKTWYFEMLGGEKNAFAISAGNDAYNSGIQAIRIDRAGIWPKLTTIVNGNFNIERGSLGIGTASPQAKLDIGTNTPFTGKLVRLIGHSNNDDAAHIEIGDGGSIYWRLLRLSNNSFRTKMSSNWNIVGGNVGIENPTPHSKLDVGTNTEFTGKLIRAIGHSNHADAANIEIGDGGAIHWRLLRLSNNTFQTKMSGQWSILGGNVGIGTSTPTEKLHVVGKVVATGGFVQSSDVNLKKNIQTIDKPLEKISLINGVSFEWRDSSMGEDKDIGIIAQDVEEVFPEVVVTDGNGYKSVNYANLVAPLIEAVKALKNKNDILSQENAALKSQHKNLEDRLLEIESFITSLK